MSAPIDPARFRVRESGRLDFDARDTTADDLLPPDRREEIEDGTDALTDRVRDLQDVFFADGRHRLLVVVQAIDTGGKDGLIRNVFGKVHPAGVRVAPFKKPTEPELARDYLWRCHRQVPADGEWVIFNRSHYEDILVVRVHEWIDEETVSHRQRHIREFEQMLVDEGTTVLKFFLHISKDEQGRRLQARLDEPDKRWKFASADLEERKLWDAYQRAFEDAFASTSTAAAPWFIVPADRKWQRDHIVARTLVDTLERLDLRYPPGEPGLDKIHVI